MKTNGHENFATVLNLLLGRVHITNNERTHPELHAHLSAFFASTPPAVIAAKNLVTSLRARLVTDGGRVV